MHMPDATKIFTKDDEWTKIRKPGILVINNGDFTGIDNSLIGWQIKANQAKLLPPNSEVIDKINEKLKAKIDKGETPKVLISYNWVKEDETEIALDLVKNEDYDVIIVPSMYVFNDGSSTNGVIGNYAPDLYNILERLNQKIDLTIDDSTEDADMTTTLLAKLNKINDKKILQDLNKKINTFTINATSPNMDNEIFYHARTNFRKGYNPILINIIYEPSYTNITQWKRPSFAFLQYKLFKTSSHSKANMFASPPNVTLTIDISAVENYLLKRGGVKISGGITEADKVMDELLQMTKPGVFTQFSYNVKGLANRPKHENEKVKKIVDDFYLDWLIVSKNLNPANKELDTFIQSYIDYDQDDADDATKERLTKIYEKYTDLKKKLSGEEEPIKENTDPNPLPNPLDNPPPPPNPSNNKSNSTGGSISAIGDYDIRKEIPKQSKNFDERQKEIKKRLAMRIPKSVLPQTRPVSQAVIAHANTMLSSIATEYKKAKELEAKKAEANKPDKKQTMQNDTYQPPNLTQIPNLMPIQNTQPPPLPSINVSKEQAQRQSYIGDVIGGLLAVTLATTGAFGFADKTPLPQGANIALVVSSAIILLFVIADISSKKNIENNSTISLKNDTQKKQI